MRITSEFGNPIKLLFLLSLPLILTVQSFAQAVEKVIDTEFDNCTSIMVGKKASTDGSTITSHSCDSRSDRTWVNIVPRMKHVKGTMAKVYFEPKLTTMPDQPNRKVTVEIPQVTETYAYFNAAYPIMNEYQLAIGESTFGGKDIMQSDSGKIDCPELYRLALERAKTAREAIKVIDELTKRYGYNDVGECFTFADPNEVWYFEIVGPGKGKIGAVWAAVRVPDDHISVNANASRIRTLNLKDKENFLASDNVFSKAEELGLWNSKSGQPFEFCYVYANRNSLGCRRREWRVLSLVAPSLKLDANAENYPISVKPEKKYSAQEVVNMFRDYYQDTPFDMTKTILTVDKEGKSIISPVANPFMNNDLKSLFKVSSERTIACVRATYVQVTQSRSWLPNEIGGIVWFGYDNPTATPHIPYYIGNTTMPNSYMVDGRAKFNKESAWWAFRVVSQLAMFRWQDMIKEINPVWQEIENKAFNEQSKIEEQALILYKEDPNTAKDFLTKYSNNIANNAVERYWLLYEELWSKYTQKF
ncbi:MAG: hypothetical protein EHM93_01075 [Bacteroidales bacterium]|nr:MAG: hypothetical protein EHM93_01075 [Bacteroidales bacterium]